MTTIAIVGAGPGLGAAIARRFGAEGHSIALVSRNQQRLDHLAGDLTDEGHTARGYAANVRDRQALTAALDQAAQDLGTIEVLEYSPLPHKEFPAPGPGDHRGRPRRGDRILRPRAGHRGAPGTARGPAVERSRNLHEH